MWAYPTGWREALTGDISLTVAAAVTYGGSVTVDGLPINGGTVTSELAGGQVQTSVDVEVADNEGTLWTGLEDSPLDVIGHRLHLTSTVHSYGWSATIPEGVFRVNRVEPSARAPWRLYAKSGQWVRGSQVLRVSCGDLLDQVADEDFLTPVSPAASAVTGSEIRRIMSGVVPVGASASALSRSVPSSVVYDNGDRLGALVDLMRVEGRVPVMDRAGVLQAVDAGGSGQTWPVPMDALVEAVPTADRGDLKNGYVLTSESADREPLRGQALENGRLRWGGPFGRVPAFHHAPIITGNAALNRAAATMLASHIAARRTPLTVMAGIDPAVDVLDVAVIDLPSGPVSGLITRIQRPLLGRTMTVTVSMDWGVLYG